MISAHAVCNMRFLAGLAILSRASSLVLQLLKGRIRLDAQTIRTLMDIQAMQSLGTMQSLAERQSVSSSMFSDLINEMMFSIGESGSSTNQLQSFGMFGGLQTLESLQYSGSNQVYMPSSLSDALQRVSETYSYDSGRNYSGDYSEIIKEAAERYNLPENLIASVIKQESNFNHQVVSRAGAMGLMQLMPMTAKFLGVQDAFNPQQNIMGGAKYLRQMMDQFDQRIELALAAYNAGPGNVKKYGGIPPFKETQQYVGKVLSYYHRNTV